MMTNLASETGNQAHVTVRDGARIAYRLSGRPDSKDRLVLLHSLGMDGTFWQPVIDRLADRAAILAIDCRGHGASDKSAGPYTVEQFAQDAHDVCAALRFDDVLVAGASMGGCVALQFAASFPATTRALGLIDTTAWYGPTAPADWNTRADNARANGLPSLVQFQVTRWFSDAFRVARPEVVADCVQTFLRNDIEAFAATCVMLGAFDGRAQLATIQVPTAVVVGEEDYAAPVAMAQALHEGIANSSLRVIAQARHLTPLETPDIVAEQLQRLLDAPRRA
jgi:3-oxoadipate enol-lactonase